MNRVNIQKIIIALIILFLINLPFAHAQVNDVRLGDDYKTVLSIIKNDPLYDCCYEVKKYNDKIIVMDFMSRHYGDPGECIWVYEFSFTNNKVTTMSYTDPAVGLLDLVIKGLDPITVNGKTIYYSPKAVRPGFNYMYISYSDWFNKECLISLTIPTKLLPDAENNPSDEIVDTIKPQLDTNQMTENDTSTVSFTGGLVTKEQCQNFNRFMMNNSEKVVRLAVLFNEDQDRAFIKEYLKPDKFNRIVFAVSNDPTSKSSEGNEYLIHLPNANKNDCKFKYDEINRQLSGYFRVYDINGPHAWGWYSVNLEPVDVQSK